MFRVCVEWCVNNYYDDCVVQSGNTPIIGAVSFGHTMIVELLLGSGAEIDTVNKVRRCVAV